MTDKEVTIENIRADGELTTVDKTLTNLRNNSIDRAVIPKILPQIIIQMFSIKTKAFINVSNKVNRPRLKVAIQAGSRQLMKA